MEDNKTKSPANYEKMGLYVSLTLLFLTLMTFLYQLKNDEIKHCERITKLESDFGHEKRLKAIEEKLK